MDISVGMSEIAKAEDVIARKGADVFSIGPDATIRDAAQLMCERRIGVLVVTGVKGQAIGPNVTSSARLAMKVKPASGNFKFES